MRGEETYTLHYPRSHLGDISLNPLSTRTAHHQRTPRLDQRKEPIVFFQPPSSTVREFPPASRVREISSSAFLSALEVGMAAVDILLLFVSELSRWNVEAEPNDDTAAEF